MGKVVIGILQGSAVTPTAFGGPTMAVANTVQLCLPKL